MSKLACWVALACVSGCFFVGLLWIAMTAPLLGMGIVAIVVFAMINALRDIAP